MKRYAAIFLILVVVFTGVLLVSPRFIHPRLEKELSHSLGVPVKFSSLKITSDGADLMGLQVGDFLRADEVDAYISWHKFDLHPTRMVLKKPEFRLDAGVLRTLSQERKPGKPRQYPIVFENGRLLLFGVADVAPLSGEWGTQHDLTLEHPQGGKWRYADGKVTVEGASLVALAGFMGRELPLEPGLLLSAALALSAPVKGELNLPWGQLTLAEEGQGFHIHSPSLGPFRELTVDVHPQTLSLEAHTQEPKIEAKAAWKDGLVKAEVWAARIQFGEVQLQQLDFDLHGSRLHGTLGDAIYKGLRVGPATLDLVFAPHPQGELRFARPLALEDAQKAGLAPRIGFLRGVRLQGLGIDGTRLTPRF